MLESIHAQNIADIALGGNAFIAQGTDNNAQISNEGLQNWSNQNTVISVYFYILKPQQASISLIIYATNNSDFGVKILGKTYPIHCPKNDLDTLKIADIDFIDTGYVRIDIQGKKKDGNNFGNIRSLVVQGKNVEQNITFVKDKKDFYFGRRGPSVHWNFIPPPNTTNPIEYFYNEIYVPKGNDVAGSYFEADGFSCGYFGMQVNSKTQRRVLFSVWSPYQTDNPNEIPEKEKIILIKKGKNVHGGEFGSEGSGGQSYLLYNWKADTHYAFLLKAQPNINDSTTTFTAYFKEVNSTKWLLIASFRRPKTNIYLKGLYSFLENFDPSMGNIQRGAYYCNQWICDTSSKWHPIDKAIFTTDATGNAAVRLDYFGNATKQGFYLQNCGFFNTGKTNTHHLFDNKYSEMKAPNIDLNQLP
ncbi:MAG TPA: DUF3472 domain-containing protein [Arachidicoccus sp.]